ncbi:MAG: hypothetical protein P4L93_04295 [Coriobacteriia bacterium]|nr:hypothetical protein [Coriobacteriia bacterium]
MAKSQKRCNRVVAGFALFAASAAVASAAILGPAAGAAVAAPPNLGGATVHAAHLPAARVATQDLLGHKTAASSKRTGSAIATAAGIASVLGAQSVGLAEASAGSNPSQAGAWWLEYSGACSRTRGQPGPDECT